MSSALEVTATYHAHLDDFGGTKNNVHEADTQVKQCSATTKCGEHSTTGSAQHACELLVAYLLRRSQQSNASFRHAQTLTNSSTPLNVSLAHHTCTRGPAPVSCAWPKAQQMLLQL